MKTIFITFLTLAITSFAFAQQPDKVLARVRYTYTNNQDTLKTGKTRNENMLLFLGKNASLYTSYDKIIHELAVDQKSYASSISQTSSNAPRAIIIDKSAGEWLSKVNHFTFNISRKMIIKEDFVGIGYLMELPLPEIKWKISKDTINLSGISCQKATANYDGKNWTAWFAPSLPFQSGPWQLQGLPGLILQAVSEDNSQNFIFAGFEIAKENDFLREHDTRKRPNYEPGDISTIDVFMGLDVADAYFGNKIQLPTYRAVKTTKKELEKLKEAYKKDPKGFNKTLNGY